MDMTIYIIVQLHSYILAYVHVLCRTVDIVHTCRLVGGNYGLHRHFNVGKAQNLVLHQ